MVFKSYFGPDKRDGEIVTVLKRSTWNWYDVLVQFSDGTTRWVYSIELQERAS